MYSMASSPKNDKISSPATLNQGLMKSLRTMVTPLARNLSDRDDIIQEVLIKIHAQGHKVEPARFLGWLRQVCRTSAIDFYRKNKSYHALEKKLSESAEVTSNEEIQASEELAKCLRPLLKNLEVEDQLLLSAVELEGLPQTEVAERHGINYSSLKSKVQRARQKLKQEILNCCEVELDQRNSPIDIKNKKKNSCDC